MPQTWENPNIEHPVAKCKGDNDPVDVVEIGTAALASGMYIDALHSYTSLLFVCYMCTSFNYNIFDMRTYTYKGLCCGGMYVVVFILSTIYQYMYKSHMRHNELTILSYHICIYIPRMYSRLCVNSQGARRVSHDR